MQLLNHDYLYVRESNIINNNFNIISHMIRILQIIILRIIIVRLTISNQDIRILGLAWDRISDFRKIWRRLFGSASSSSSVTLWFYATPPCISQILRGNSAGVIGPVAYDARCSLQVALHRHQAKFPVASSSSEEASCRERSSLRLRNLIYQKICNLDNNRAPARARDHYGCY